MRLLLHRSASVHNNERPASPRGDVGTKVGNSTLESSGRTYDGCPLVGHMTLPHGHTSAMIPSAVGATVTELS